MISGHQIWFLYRCVGSLLPLGHKGPSPALCQCPRCVHRLSLFLSYFVSTTNWHLPSTSERIKSCAAAVTDLQHPLKKVQYVLDCQTHIYTDLPPASLEHFLKGAGAVSWAIVLILPQITLNLKLSHSGFFKVDLHYIGGSW